MLFPVIASLLLAAGAPPADADAAAAAEAAEEAADRAAEAAKATGADEAEDAPMICKRRTVQDAFGKMKSVKSCRAKAED